MCGWVVGGWSDKMKLILISTLVEVVVKVEVELCNTNLKRQNEPLTPMVICVGT